MSEWNKEKILVKLELAIELLKKNDTFLISERANERSITHKLAEYLTPQFTEYHVDCEFNKMEQGVDANTFISKSIGLPLGAEVSIDDCEARTAFPDVVIHRRENGKHNLIVIEAKIKPYSEKREDWDYKKLDAFMRPRSKDQNRNGLNYEFSAFLEFDKKTPDKHQLILKQQGESWLSQ